SPAPASAGSHRSVLLDCRHPAARGGGGWRSARRSEARARRRSAAARGALLPSRRTSADLFGEARIERAELRQAHLGCVAAPAHPALLELALRDDALVVVEQRVDLL